MTDSHKINNHDPSEAKIAKYIIEKTASASKWLSERDTFADQNKQV